MKKILLLCSFLGVAYSFNAQVNETKQINGTSGIQKKRIIEKSAIIPLPSGSSINLDNNIVNQQADDSSLLKLSPNGKLLSVDGFEVDFRLPANPAISTVCGTKRPYIDNPNGPIKSLGCPFTVPCDDPSNRDVANMGIKYYQLQWHVMQSSSGGASSNIDQTRIDGLMAELNAQFASSNMIFCADPASFYVDDVNYTHDSNTEEVSLKTTYVVNPNQFINVYVVGSMSAGGYARFPYDPMGGTSNTGGIVLNRGNLGLGGSTLAHEMGHVFGLEHTFAGVDERSDCSACYEQVRNANGSSNASGIPTPLGGPYLGEGDQEGDWCSDTNPHDTYSYNCSTSSNSNNACDTDPWANAPVNNHMSYSFCSTQFTNQQGRRMHCMSDTYLGSWIAYGGGVCGAQPPVADFVGTPTTWQAPSNVTFTDLSQPTAIITSWTWTFDVGASGTVTCAGCVGANAQFTGQVPPQVTYPNPGLYTVSLTVGSPNGPDTETKIDYIEVLAPGGDCDTLDLYWVTPTSSPTIYSFGGGEAIFGVPDFTNSPTNGVKGSYERFFSPNPGVTEVGAIRVGLASLYDPNDNMVFQVLVFDDDGAGAPGALLGGSGALSPTAIGVPGGNSFVEFWVPFTPVVPTTGTFHVGIEIFPGDPTDTLLVIASSNATTQGQGNGLNHIWTETTGYVNSLAGIGLDVDLDLYPMLGGYAPRPLITGYTENVVCDTTYVTLFDTALYSVPVSWSITFADGTVINTTTDPQIIDRVYTTPGPDTVTIATINDCGRGDTNTYIIPYNFMGKPSAEFTSSPANPICAGPPGVTFTADVSGYVDYTWDFGDGSAITSSGNVDNINYVYPTPGLYYVELSVQSAGVLPLDTFYIENFEGGWPAGYARFNNDPWTPNAGVNPPFTGTNATAWLPMDVDGDGSLEATATSWNALPSQPADDWMLTTGIGVLPANQRLFWDAQSASVNFPDGYEVRISTAQLPANVGNYNTLLFSTIAENAFSTTRSVDLSAYAGQTVFIAFRNTSDDMYLLLIDNIRIGTTAPGCSATVLYDDFVEVIDCSIIPPTAVLGSDVSSGCNPLIVTFTDNTVLGDPVTSWLWNFGDGSVSTSQNPPPHLYTTAGSYFVTFEACNSGGCTQDTISIFVGDPATIINVATTDPTCAGNDGDITVTASGGTGALQYSIDGGTTFQAAGFFGGLGGATYPIVVQDAIGCQITASVTLTAPAAPTITNVTFTDPTCFGGNDGDITITASGGTGVLQYSIDNGVTFQAGNNFMGLTAAIYSIVVEDANNCQATSTATLTDPPQVVITSATPTDPSCGLSNGGIIIVAAGGTGVLQYSVDGGTTFQASGTFGTLIAGVYNIVVQDANNCQATSTVTLTDTPGATITGVASVDPLCNGGSDGTITITATGGTGALQYSIDGGTTFQAGNNFTGLIAGTYNIVVEDGNTCQTIQTVTLVDGVSPTISNITSVDILCFGDLSGSFTINASGGTGALQYSYDNGFTFQASNTFTGLMDGVYGTIIVEDVNGCQATAPNVIITQPATAVSFLSENGTNPSCNGTNDGGITIVGMGGTGAPQYSIDNGVTFQAGNNFTGLAAGVYSIVVEDANGCQATSSITLVDPVVLSITNVAITDPTCGSANGDITITATGGTGALQYSIDGGTTFQASNVFTGLISGVYNIVVEDANLCQVTSISTLTDTGGATITSATGSDPTCFGGNDGDITILATGGTGALQYSIDGGATFQAGNNFTGLIAGVYNIVVEDGVGCQTISTVTLVDPAVITITIVTPVDPSCNGASDGTITIVAAGGTGAFQYSIDGGTTFQTGNNFTGLIAGLYNIVVQDANTCQVTSSTTLVDPAVITYTVTIIPENCGAFDGQIDLVGSGGDGGPYTYSIDGGATFQASGTFPGLVVGPYNVVIQDASACQTLAIETVGGTGGATITGIAEDISLVCNADCNGQLTATVTGGVLPYVYSWVDGTNAPVGGNSATITGLCADSYTLTVVDNNGTGCTSVMTYTLVEPSMITYTTSSTDEACGLLDGTITFSGATGGDGGPYTYSIDNGTTFLATTVFTGLAAATYNVIVQDASGCQVTSAVTVNSISGPAIGTIATTDPTCALANGDITITAAGGTGALQYSVDGGTTFQAGNNFTGLTANVYNVVVQDANGCQTTSTSTLVDLGLPIISSTGDVNPLCNGDINGSITISATGGTGTLTYSINGGATLIATNSFTGLSAAIYNIVVQDANGCQATATSTLVDPAGIVISSATGTDPLCNGATDGTILITASGGSGALQYSIDGGATFQAATSFSGLAANTYNVVVEDANNCQVTSTVTLTDPTAVAITLVTPIDPTCGTANGDITITASGGTGSLQYSIDNGATYQGGNNFVGQLPGVFPIIVQDANGCQTSSSITLTDLGVPVISSVVSNDPSCGLPNGDITITATGGTGSLQYSIDGGTTLQATGFFTGLVANTYNIVVEDANGCQVTSTATLVNGSVPSITNVLVADPTCGLANGSINIAATGGTGSLSYSIDNGTSFVASNIFTGLPGATYTVVVEDANGCQTTSTATLAATSSPVISNVSFSDPTCGLLNGDITITATGGSGTIMYSINNGATFQALSTFTAVGAGVYQIVVQDASGCQDNSSVTLTDPGSPAIINVLTSDPTCGLSNGNIIITASGGTGSIQYSIDGGATFQASGTYTNLTAAVYNVVVQDANGCQTTSTAILIDNGSPIISSTNFTDPSCGNTNGTISIVASGGTGALTYSNDGGATFQGSSGFTGLTPGTYNIVVQDASGCSVTSTVTLTGGTVPVITINSVSNLACFGDANGQVDITITGGQAPYVYDWNIDGTGDLDDPQDLTNGVAGVFSVTVVDDNGCSDFITGTINGPPGLILTTNVNDATVAGNGSINLTVNGGTGPFTYDWDNDGVGDNDDPEDIFGLAGNSSYTVIVTDVNGCSTTLTVFVGSVVGINEVVSKMGVSVYPNPTSGSFKVEFLDFSGDIKFEIVDVAGKLIYFDVKYVDAGQPVNLSIKDVESGMYFLRIENDEQKASIRILKN